MGRDTTTSEWLLAIDVGTSYSAGCLWAAGETVPLELGGERRMPSAVFLDDEGQLVVGSAAVHEAGLAPERFEPTPKAYVGRSQVIIGGVGVAVDRMLGAVIGAFLSEARRQRGGSDPAAVALTHPARWSDERLDSLRAAAATVGVLRPVLVPEPVAAATHYLQRQPLPGQRVAVYDLGGGTFDTAVLSAGGDGRFVVVGQPGGDATLGGDVFDHRLFELVGNHLAQTSPEVWAQLAGSNERRWRRAALDLMREVRRAKEVLSERTRTAVYVSEADRDVTITRTEFEALIADDVVRTVDELERTIDEAGTDGEISAVYLAGGSSRIPMVGQQVQERFGDRVQTWGDPKTVVAMGAATALDQQLRGPGAHTPTAAEMTVAAAPTAPLAPPPAASPPPGSFPGSAEPMVPGAGPTAPPTAAPVPVGDPPAPRSPTSGRAEPRHRGLLVGALVALAVVVGAVALLAVTGRDGTGTDTGGSANGDAPPVVAGGLDLADELERESVLSGAVLGCDGPGGGLGFAQQEVDPCAAYCGATTRDLVADEAQEPCDGEAELRAALGEQRSETDGAVEAFSAAVDDVDDDLDEETLQLVENATTRLDDLAIVRAGVDAGQFDGEAAANALDAVAESVLDVVGSWSRAELDADQVLAVDGLLDLAEGARLAALADASLLSVAPGPVSSSSSPSVDDVDALVTAAADAFSRWEDAASPEAKAAFRNASATSEIRRGEDATSNALTGEPFDQVDLLSGGLSSIDASADVEELVLDEIFG